MYVFSGGNYDKYIQENLQKNIFETINCSIPFIPPKYRNGTKLCSNSSLGKSGVEIYKSSPIELTNLWSGESFVHPPCRYHQFEARDRSIERGDNSSFHSGTQRFDWSGSMILYLNINSKMRITEQFWSYGLLAFVAETGGFVGLFLGFSILDMRIVIELFCRKLSLYEKETKK